jgi:hypothetical protein
VGSIEVVVVVVSLIAFEKKNSVYGNQKTV